VISWFHSSG